MNLLMLSGDSSVAQGRQGAFYEMLRRFARHWSRLDIITPSAPCAAPRCIHDHVYIHPANASRALQPLFIRRKGAQLLAERPYALVVSHDYGFFYNGIGAWWLLRNRNIPYVSEIHHVEGYPRAVSLRERAWRAAAMRYLPFVAKRAAAIRVVNRNEVPTLLRKLGVPDDKILVLSSLYLDFEVLQAQDVPKRYDLLFVARLAANKGILTLLRAVAQVKHTHPQLQLAIRGDGPLRTQAEAFIVENDLAQNVQFLPRVADAQAMTTLYNQATMLVCASTVEGNPRVTAEAMACGVPVISTPVGIMPEIMQDGVSGLFFNWDADELAAKIRLLLDDAALRERLGAAGRRAVQPFDADTVIARYAEAYRALALQA